MDSFGRSLADISQRYAAIEERILGAVARAGRKRDDITLVAVSKFQPLQSMLDYAALPATRERLIFGENYVQEFAEKRAHLPPHARCHFLGHLQRNKAKLAVQLFDCIETVDRPELADALEKECKNLEKSIDVFLQVNISSDDAKAGFAPAALEAALERLLTRCPHLRVRGLMTITRLYEMPELARGDFRNMRLLGESVRERVATGRCQLSMGMSADFEVAIEEGATHIRLGTALFGERKT